MPAVSGLWATGVGGADDVDIGWLNGGGLRGDPLIEGPLGAGRSCAGVVTVEPCDAIEGC